MDKLRGDARGHAVAKQVGRNSATPAYLRSAASLRTLLVPGRGENRIHGEKAGKTVEDLCDLPRRRKPRGASVGESSGNRSELVTRREVRGIWLYAVVRSQGNLGHHAS